MGNMVGMDLIRAGIMAIWLWSFQTGGTKLEIFLPENQHIQFNNFLWVCWFLGKNLSNFVPSAWKLHNSYCHNQGIAYLICSTTCRHCAHHGARSAPYIILCFFYYQTNFWGLRYKIIIKKQLPDTFDLLGHSIFQSLHWRKEVGL